MANPTTIRLRFSNGRDDFVSTAPYILIGRNADCDLSLPNARNVSRCHAKICMHLGKLYILDMNSANGTWLNGTRLVPNQEYQLNVGDVIELAKAETLTVVELWYPGAGAAGDTVSLEDYGRDACVASSGPDWGNYRGFPDSGRPFTSALEAPPCPPSMPPRPSAPPPAPMYAPSQAPAPSRAPVPPPAPMCAPSQAPSVGRAPVPSQAPKKKGGFLSSLFGGKKNSDPAPAASVPPVQEPVTADDVQFRGTAPQTINPGEYFPVKIMMYREDDYARADRESAAVADKTKSASSSVFQATRGQQFRISLQSPDIPLDCETQILNWNGKFSTADFEVYLPEDYDRKQLRLQGRVYSGDAVLTDLKLILQIGAVQPVNVPCEKVLLRSAFISYASADRAKVVARIQGIQLACPDMDLFFDVESLRRGENWESRLYREISGRDLFYLFWSHNAAASDWVQKELQYALSQKTVDYIEPIPLEGPDICPPPESLMGKHFNDWTLRYLGNQ